ncbi:MAG: hypothetical protein GTN38_04015 [Candidatus Aenigmarchaeota archaeon]|nr:hypothetical protein [Candidatus Aenigmarchaeota archaeon]NIP40828.1 hypothetical protein [Candidatus Aenigmarchaeota archaeon]NIQ17942.1 hypothetical protein [Candidatus Aenigmarchaeota archaeon]NIS73531.1 hypothetical protein [Candidatus Aenigmarchaeota archaeon]
MKEVESKVEIVKSRHIDFGVYGSDTRFIFTGADGETYIEKKDFNNDKVKGIIEKEGGKLYFCFTKYALGGV